MSWCSCCAETAISAGEEVLNLLKLDESVWVTPDDDQNEWADLQCSQLEYEKDLFQQRQDLEAPFLSNSSPRAVKSQTNNPILRSLESHTDTFPLVPPMMYSSEDEIDNTPTDGYLSSSSCQKTSPRRDCLQLSVSTAGT